MTQDTTDFPRISALVRADATGQVIIDGVSQIVVAIDDAGVREEIVAVATRVARTLDSPVRLEVEDEQGLWPLIIHPTGRVESTGDVIATTGPLGTHTVALTGRGPADTGESSETDDALLAADGSAPDALSDSDRVPDAHGDGTANTDREFALDADSTGAGVKDANNDRATRADSGRDANRSGLIAAELEPVTNLSFADLLRPTAFTHPLTTTSAPAEPRSSSRSAGFSAADLAPFEPEFVPASASRGLERTPDADEADSDISFITSLMAAPALPESGTEAWSGSPTRSARTDHAARARPSEPHDPPNLADFMSSRPPAPAGPARQGWQGAIRRLTGGLISVSPGSAELDQRNAIAAVQRSLSGPRTIVVLNPKGGAHKTTATLLIAATFGIYRGGYTLAWDNNETMGTLGVRAQSARHTNTAVDLLRDLDRFSDVRSARVGDLDNYVRNQGDAQFDALASDLDPAGAASIDAVAFRKLHATLSRFYRVLVIDTGNNMRASNWEAAVDTADQLVVVSTIREDTGYGAASLLDGLRRKGHANKVDQAVTILASPSKTVDQQLSARLHEHFGQLTRTVLDVPYDPSLVGGGPLNVDTLAPRTRAAWLQATAAIAEGL
ncbi:chromosome partitioning protein [Cryobacterium sp. CG_9.6]|uniref:chromosome partitioning protein n=1 Tax=Cryobacterium sp. CG_9.6 TaxID=2760710 RepID=UPI002473A5DE|nr:chromosome partitioning protein [Cryobacterium sp. CG_9.6]MDH6235623.1 MinD-like ATPase involved in chromosome partitioning or flagellar assembly [Cryobacterium sp. CG_9.6]